MIVQKIHIISSSSILILFCVQIAHTALAEQQDSSDVKIVDLCKSPYRLINVASNDTGFILTSNCTSNLLRLFSLSYVDANANDAEVILGWSSPSDVSIGTGTDGQILAKNVTATESYWNPPEGKVLFLPNNHSVTLTVFKGCPRVVDESASAVKLSDPRKQRFTCEGFKQLAHNINKLSDAHVLSCDLNTQTWEDYDISCNGLLRCVDLKSNQQPEECEVWRIHEDTGFIVTCSNAISADEPSFNLECENGQQVLGFLGGLFRSEMNSLEVTCKESSGNKSWVTSTNEINPSSEQLSCLDRFIECSTTGCIQTCPSMATVDEGNGVAALGYIIVYWTMLAIHGLT